LNIGLSFVFAEYHPSSPIKIESIVVIDECHSNNRVVIKKQITPMKIQK